MSKCKLTPCIKCGSKEILFSDCGYSSFNFASFKCKKCKNEVSFQCGTFPKQKESEHLWNKQNDVRFIRQVILKSIRDEIAKLSKTDKDCIHTQSCFTMFSATIEIEKRDNDNLMVDKNG